ncbi:unnamed protein product [Cylicostephanus goldi]|uniref:Uncharacterized protein n=1 Tax=Cylicostephanus goldi TaxID=71465 RepID=A0A3P7N5S3_CYLGO|nr:unnamed protein product [Cylicostephanus goldi]
MIDDKFANADRFTIQRQINPQYDESSDAERRSEPKRWQKQPTIVAKRNARERTRVHTVNQEGAEDFFPTMANNYLIIESINVSWFEIKAYFSYLFFQTSVSWVKPFFSGTFRTI